MLVPGIPTPPSFVRPGLLTEGKGLATFGLPAPGSQPSTWEGLLSAKCPGGEGLPTTVPGAEGEGEAVPAREEIVV